MPRLAATIALGLLAAAIVLCTDHEAPAARPAGLPGQAEVGPDALSQLLGQENPWRNMRRPFVTSLAFSPDGRWLVISHYISPMNEPGTDWMAWVTVWNLATGKRVLIPNACGPVAISPDNSTFFANLYKPNGHWPACQPALWMLGKSEPDQVLQMPADAEAPAPEVRASPNEVIAATFDPRTKIPYAFTETGDIITWSLAKLKAPAQKLGSWDGLQNQRQSQAVTLAITNESRLVAVSPARGTSAFWYLGGMSKWPFELGLWQINGVRPTHAALFDAGQGIGLLSAFSSLGKTFIISDKGKTLAMMPGGGCAAFADNGKLLAAADERGIVRIWDWQAGKLLHTLGFDEAPLPNTVRVAAIQVASEFGKPDANRLKLAKLITEAARGGAEIVVLPETAVTGYMDYDLGHTWQVDKRELSWGLRGVDPAAAAEAVPGPSTEFFGTLADQLGIYLTVPLLEIDKKSGRYFNTSVLLGPDGKILIHYRKCNPWPWAEKGWATDGDFGNPVADTPWGRLGCLICFDIHQQAANLAEQKVDILLYSIAWVENWGSQWFAKNLPAIAKKSGFAMVAANWTVPKKPVPMWFGYGQSRIIDSSGKIVAKSQDLFEEGVIYADLPVGPQGPAPAAAAEKIEPSTP